MRLQRLPWLRKPGVQSLAGEWLFSLDRDDVGVKETWFAQDLPATTHIALPGILQTQGYGDDITAETKFIAALPRDMAWYKLPQYAAYTKPGHVEVPYLSQPVKHYLGVAWYQRDIEIPAALARKARRSDAGTHALGDDRLRRRQGDGQLPLAGRAARLRPRYPHSGQAPAVHPYRQQHAVAALPLRRALGVGRRRQHVERYRGQD